MRGITRLFASRSRAVSSSVIRKPLPCNRHDRKTCGSAIKSCDHMVQFPCNPFSNATAVFNDRTGGNIKMPRQTIAFIHYLKWNWKSTWKNNMGYMDFPVPFWKVVHGKLRKVNRGISINQFLFVMNLQHLHSTICFWGWQILMSEFHNFQVWLISSEALLQSHEGNLIGNVQDIYAWFESDSCTFNITAISSRGQWI